MSLPATIRVKLSSEAAEGISITQVVVQELPLRDLVEHMLGITGKNEARVRELLLRGTLVSGASRFRWIGWEAEIDGLRELLATFPGDDPARLFASARCVRAVLRGGRQAIHIPREAGAGKPSLLKWPRKASFWDVYLQYSYKDRADCFRFDMPLAAAEKLRAAGEVVKYSSLREQIRSAGFVWAELYVER